MDGTEKESSQIDSFDFLHEEARQAFSKGQFPKAELLCRKAIALEPNSVGVLNLLGQTELALGKPPSAITLFAKAISLAPQQPNLYFNQTLAQQAEGSIEAALQSISTAITLDPSVAILHAKLGQLLLLANSPREAVGVLRHALELDAKSVPIRLNLAQALLDLGNVTEAELLVRAALFLKPNDHNAYRLLGRIQQMGGQFSDAAISLTKSISLQPTAAAYFALIYSKQIGPEDAAVLQELSRLVSLPGTSKSDQELLFYALGKGLDELGLYEQAASHFVAANDIALSRRLSSEASYFAKVDSQRVDEIIDQFSVDLLSRWSELGSVSIRPIFIVGMIRSGTTLIEQILARHPEVIAGGELPYWITNEGKMREDQISHPKNSPDTETWRFEYEAELDRISPLASRITDKMPLNYQALGLIHMAYPNAKIIHCKRNPLDTCLSIYVTPYRRAPAFAHDLVNIGAAYEQYLRLMAHWRNVIPSSCLLEVDYETLVAKPESSTRNLLEFCELDWDDVCLDPNRDARIVNTPSQWQVRQPIYRRSVNRWENYRELLAPILRLIQE